MTKVRTYAVNTFSDTDKIIKDLKEQGYKIIATSTDIKHKAFTVVYAQEQINYNDIISNPPYVMAKEFCEHALDISADGVKVAMFLKITFLESQSRKAFFQKYPIKYLYVFSQRMNCAKNGEFEKYQSNAVAYGWYIWEKGFKGEPIIRWI